MQRRFVHRKGSFHCRCRAALGAYYGGLQITLRPEHGSDAELRGCEMCDEKNYCFSFCSPSPVEKRILSLSEGKHFPFHGKCQSRSVCLQKQQDLDCTQQAVAVRKGRKEIANPQERPHPFLEGNTICSVLRGRMERKRGWTSLSSVEKNVPKHELFPLTHSSPFQIFISE